MMSVYSFINAGYGDYNGMVLKWQDLLVHCHDIIIISWYSILTQYYILV